MGLWNADFASAAADCKIDGGAAENCGRDWGSQAGLQVVFCLKICKPESISYLPRVSSF